MISCLYKDVHLYDHCFLLCPIDVRDLISNMLNPNSFSRITIDQVLNHPWLVGKTERRRKTPIVHPPPELKIDGLCDCNCSCHNGETLDRRDSVFTKHCADCELIVANDYDLSDRQLPDFSRCSSTTSSGYGSDFGSQYLPVESPVCVKPFNKFLMVEERRNSIPRKNKLSTPHGRNSVPTNSPGSKLVYSSECGAISDDGTVSI